MESSGRVWEASREVSRLDLSAEFTSDPLALVSLELLWRPGEVELLWRPGEVELEARRSGFSRDRCRSTLAVAILSWFLEACNRVCKAFPDPSLSRVGGVWECKVFSL